MRCSHCGQGSTKSPSILCQWCNPTKQDKWRHMKTGNVYTMLGKAHVQTSTPLVDHTEVVVYQAADGRLWVRPTAEFHERFDRKERE